jgi:pimeloyl-ACP methyl ester carboxylesterase
MRWLLILVVVLVALPVALFVLMDFASRRTIAGLRKADPADPPELRFPAERTHRVDVGDGAFVDVVELGAGRPVLVLHGWASNVNFFGPFARRLADAGHRVVAVDQRGSGGSSPARPGITIPDLARDAQTVLRSLDLRDVVVVGHSMGGIISQELAARDRAEDRRVTALVLMNSSPHLPTSAVKRVMGRITESSMTARMGSNPRYGLLATRTGFGASATYSLLEASRAAGVVDPPANRKGLVSAMLGYDLTPQLAALDIPVLVLAGTADRVLPQGAAEAFSSGIPGVVVRSFEGAGHMLMLEQPQESADAVLGFLSGPVVTHQDDRPAAGRIDAKPESTTQQRD